MNIVNVPIGQKYTRAPGIRQGLHLAETSACGVIESVGSLTPPGAYFSGVPLARSTTGASAAAGLSAGSRSSAWAW
jgi:hypothetical protein